MSDVAACATVAELIEALSDLDPSATVFGLHPPFTGVRIIPQSGGGVLIAGPPREAMYGLQTRVA